MIPSEARIAYNKRSIRGAFLTTALVLLPVACGAPSLPPQRAPAPTTSATSPALSPSAPAPQPPSPTASSSAGWEVFGTNAPRPLFEAAVDRWSTTNRCSGYDYFPNGGIQTFWCHRPEDLDLAQIRALAGVNIFQSGPHTKDTLALGNPHAFGHYNPAFARWLVEKAAPSGRDTAFRKATQSAYDINLRPLAEIFWRVHRKLSLDESCFQREKDLYEKNIQRHTLPVGYHERWFFVMNPYFCKRNPGVAPWNDTFYYENGFDAGIDGNIAKTVMGFWLRRTIDGTRATFVEGLTKLIASYQPSLLADTAPLPDPEALTRAVNQATRDVHTCASANPGGGPFTIAIQPSGKLRLQAGAFPPAARACIDERWSKIQVAPFTGSDIPFQRNAKM